MPLLAERGNLARLFGRPSVLRRRVVHSSKPRSSLIARGARQRTIPKRPQTFGTTFALSRRKDARLWRAGRRRGRVPHPSSIRRATHAIGPKQRCRNVALSARRAAQEQVRYRLKTAYRDGTTHIVLEPMDFIARLAALVARPQAHLTQVSRRVRGARGVANGDHPGRKRRRVLSQTQLAARPHARRSPIQPVLSTRFPDPKTPRLRPANRPPCVLPGCGRRPDHCWRDIE